VQGHALRWWTFVNRGIMWFFFEGQGLLSRVFTTDVHCPGHPVSVIVSTKRYEMESSLLSISYRCINKQKQQMLALHGPQYHLQCKQ